MLTLNRRLVAGIVVAGIAAVPGVAVATAAAPSHGAAVVAGVHSQKPSEDKESKASLDEIQKVLKSIQEAKTPSDLKKELNKDIATLTDNESAVPSDKKKEFNKFRQELQLAAAKDSLEGDDAKDTLKKIQEDAKALSSELE
ncbi:hypothetical protein [Tsukamurella sp. 1534]|uniref:hypothetical protein n=1 Tax=Tsukamurella sp. 1534 TaxID=1151061 RepID=UPI0002E8B2F3|nr:hypothetical protein [Tsukamurella sp. 1534]